MRASSRRLTPGAGRPGGVPHGSGQASAGRAGRLAGLAAVCFLWAGMVLGISFLEAPVKFQAPSLSLAEGLDVGRHVFGAFSLVEVLLGVIAVSIALWARPARRLPRLSLALVVTVVAAQVLWLLPILDARVEVHLAGQTPPPAPYHLTYIGLEVVKLMALIASGLGCLRGALGRARREEGGKHEPGRPSTPAGRRRGEEGAHAASAPRATALDERGGGFAFLDPESAAPPGRPRRPQAP